MYSWAPPWVTRSAASTCCADGERTPAAADAPTCWSGMKLKQIPRPPESWGARNDNQRHFFNRPLIASGWRPDEWWNPGSARPRCARRGSGGGGAAGRERPGAGANARTGKRLCRTTRQVARAGGWTGDTGRLHRSRGLFALLGVQPGREFLLPDRAQRGGRGARACAGQLERQEMGRVSRDSVPSAARPGAGALGRRADGPERPRRGRENRLRERRGISQPARHDRAAGKIFPEFLYAAAQGRRHRLPPRPDVEELAGAVGAAGGIARYRREHRRDAPDEDPGRTRAADARHRAVGGRAARGHEDAPPGAV